MNVFDYLFESTKDLKKEVVLSTKDTISYNKLYQNSLKIASYLNKTIGENQNVILISPNSTFFITAYLGILKSGNICIPLNYSIEQSNLDYIMRTTKSNTIFIARDLISKLKFKSAIQFIDKSKMSLLIGNNELIEKKITFDENQVAEIIFTSGSTGEPKGVMISHQNIISNTNSIIEYLKLTQNDIMCVVLPFYYCYGLSLLHTHLKVGGSLVLNNNFIFFGTVINDLKNYKCTGFAGVPSHFQILLKKAQTFKTTKFPDLRYVTQAGGKLHAVFIEEFVKAFPKINFYVMYGQTEATARLSYLSPEMIKIKTSSIGKNIPNVELKIVNKRGENVGINEEGELLAYGKNIMLGYYKDKALTKRTIKNGWLYTGDMAKTDKDGFIYLVSRKKEIIKVGGKRVSPKEIEAVILSIPEVIDCSISSFDDVLLGEAIQASIVLNGNLNQSLLKEKIFKKCSQNLSYHKIPHKIIFETSMNMSETGKKIK